MSIYHPHKRCVYFMLAGDAIKIGCTERLEIRRRQIAIDIGLEPELIGFVYANFQTEQLIHKRLKPFAEGNEWFRDCEEVRQLIDYLIAKGPMFQGLPPLR